LGANAYVLKPVQFKDFVASVGALALFWTMLKESPPGSARQMSR
jgi:hypothetical protein